MMFREILMELNMEQFGGNVLGKKSPQKGEFYYTLESHQEE